MSIAWAGILSRLILAVLILSATATPTGAEPPTADRRHQETFASRPMPVTPLMPGDATRSLNLRLLTAILVAISATPAVIGAPGVLLSQDRFINADPVIAGSFDK